MNWKAIDAGFDAYHKVEVPADWANAADDKAPEALHGNAATVDMVRSIMEPVARMDGDSLPVSAFEKYVDGQFEQGASAYEKRGVAVNVPEWNPDTCIQCNQCAFVCPHATIRPFALTADEAAKAPAALKSKAMNGKGCENYVFAMTVSPLDCMGCGRLRERLPHRRQGHPEDGAAGEPGRPAGGLRLLRREHPQEGRHDARDQREGQPVQPAPAGVLRQLRRLRRDRLRPSGHPAVRRADVHLQRHRLLFHLGRPRRYLSLHPPAR